MDIQRLQVTHPSYTDVPKRWLAFEEIARVLTDEEVAFTSDMIKLAWKNMMDYYNQIRRRYDRAIAAGLNPPESKWQFYHMMHFTRQDKPPVKRKYNWMQPSKIPRSGESFVEESTNATPPAAVRDANASFNQPCDYSPNFQLPSIRDGSEMNTNIVNSRRLIIRSHTKQPERMRLETRRGALRDSNHDLMGEQQYMNRSSVRKREYGDDSDSSFDEFESSTIPWSSGVVANHEMPSGGVRKSARLLNAKRIVVRKSIPAHFTESKEKPIAALDSTSSFARRIAARLYIIKDLCPSRYLSLCYAIDEAIKEEERELNIVPDN
ncbi:unnamed protein product [Dracunculus medinensis]|uniref:MADF domain-containing protein n=1 Tax=Dracunculus medinensis TaxID=318479 RepID=A0A0N4U0U2_DRAME|nr:unnamed protein product [Dracunculus medinensis]